MIRRVTDMSWYPAPSANEPAKWNSTRESNVIQWIVFFRFNTTTDRCLIKLILSIKANSDFLAKKYLLINVDSAPN